MFIMFIRSNEETHRKKNTFRVDGFFHIFEQIKVSSSALDPFSALEKMDSDPNPDPGYF